MHMTTNRDLAYSHMTQEELLFRAIKEEQEDDDSLGAGSYLS